MSDTVYNGPVCPSCVNHKYTIRNLGDADFKECTECGMLTLVTDDDELTPIDQ